MKPDNNPVFCHSNLVCKHDSKSFEYNSSAVDTVELETKMKDNQNWAIFNDNDKDEFWNSSKYDWATLVHDSANSNENELNGTFDPRAVPSGKVKLFKRDNDFLTDRNDNENVFENGNESIDSANSCTISSNKMGFFEETNWFTDKNVMECELPELVVCYRENMVKDICVDEGVPSKENILVDRENGKGLSTLHPSYINPFDDFTKPEEKTEFEDCEYEKRGNVGVELPLSEGLKSSSESHFEGDISHDSISLVPIQGGEANHNDTKSDKIEDEVLGKTLVRNDMPSLGKLGEQKSFKSLLDSPASDNSDIGHQPDQIPCSQATCESGRVVSAEEEANQNNPVNDLSYNSKIECGTITFDFKSAESTANSVRDESPDDVDQEQALKVNSLPRHDNTISQSLAGENEVHLGHGESSFSMAGPALGLVTYSGPIAFSGSISIRSDSSTTSTRSFAFPMYSFDKLVPVIPFFGLQPEWNSSPVRMAKADRGQYRRHKGWRHGLFCCRF